VAWAQKAANNNSKAKTACADQEVVSRMTKLVHGLQKNLQLGTDHPALAGGSGSGRGKRRKQQ